ncbi:O-antigen ligase family protein [Aureimonas ureilytica]|uniref:O-antigen ligase family protein n=1 Tax=Aureimonas ureilytica TaxID=401562 RepID=UPI000377BD3B|nr:O-antigen ligase [Aureimonas ureilytica]
MSSFAGSNLPGRSGQGAGALGSRHGRAGSAPADASAQAVYALRTLLASVILTVGFVSLTPYAAVYTGDTGGNILNQLGYGLLAGIALVGHLVFTDRRVARSLLRPSWVLLTLWFALSAFETSDPSDTMRGVVFSTISMVAVTGALCLPPDGRALRFALAVAVLAALFLSYLGVFVWPSLGRHVGDVHAGLWRGIYSHKNVAGAVMAVFFFSGVYLFRMGHWVLGALIAVLSAIFILRTGSKTSLGLTVIVFAVVMSAHVLRVRAAPVIVSVVALAGAAFFTVGSVIFPFSHRVVQSIAPGTSFTGRLELWRLALNALQSHGWTGYGFGAFWTAANLAQQEVPMEFAWDPRGAVNAHEGYLDIALSIGWPGLVLALWVLVGAPLVAYLRVRGGRESAHLADFFLMSLLFLLLNALLESFFFERANTLWIMTFLMVAGLNLLGRFRTA